MGPATFPKGLSAASIFLNKAGTALIEENSVLYKAGTGLKQDPFPIRPGALFKAGHFVCHRAALNRDLYCIRK